MRGWQFGRPLDIGCGTIVPVRTSALCAAFSYAYDREHAPSGAEDKVFEFDLITVTTQGVWQFFGRRGEAEIDAEHLLVGAYGDAYGCRHDRRRGDANVIFALRPNARDGDAGRLFDHQIVGGGGLTALVRAALAAGDEDAFDSLVFELFAASSARSLPRASAGFARVRVQRAKRFIERHAFEPVSLEKIAGEVKLSPFLLHRQFRAMTGTTPHAYGCRLRFERAKRLLERSALGVRGVAERCGFDDVAYFSRFFKKRAGISPIAFRRARRS